MRNIIKFAAGAAVAAAALAGSAMADTITVSFSGEPSNIPGYGFTPGYYLEGSFTIDTDLAAYLGTNGYPALHFFDSAALTDFTLIEKEISSGDVVQTLSLNTADMSGVTITQGFNGPGQTSDGNNLSISVSYPSGLDMDGTPIGYQIGLTTMHGIYGGSATFLPDLLYDDADPTALLGAVTASTTIERANFSEASILSSAALFGANYLMDNISISFTTDTQTDPGSEVPLPAAAFLFGPVLGAAGLLRRRRKAAAKKAA